MIVGIWLLNFVISWVNAWGCGKSLNEARHRGGFALLTNWSAAVMSAAGFTWCYTLLIGFVGTLIHTSDPHPHAVVSPVIFEAMQSLGYLVIYFPIVGSGIVITLAMWRQAYRERSFGTGAVAAYDTFAQIYNIAAGFHEVPSALTVLKFFGTKNKDGDIDLNLVVALVLFATIGGILTTYAIMAATARKVARSVPRPEYG